MEIKTREEIERMKKAGRLAGLALQAVAKEVKPGVTTRFLNDIAESFIRQGGGIPTFIGYRGYPASLCVSINDEVVHGIPGERRIAAGDVVSLDIAATVDGFVGDTALTVTVEPVSDIKRRLVDVTKASLEAAIHHVRKGRRLGDIGAAVQQCAEEAGFGVIRDYVGHGIGRRMHEEPSVPNYGRANTGLRLEPGMVLAIEPMVTVGHYEVKTLKDGWTVVTQDKSLAAHFEHTIAVTDSEPIVLTQVS